MSRFFVLCLFLLFSIGLLAQSTANADSKIDTRLLEQLTAGQETEFLIVMTQQADLRGAKQLKSKNAKGRFVYEISVNLAESTQVQVRELLKTAQVPAQSFWIINAVWAKGDLDLVRQIAALPEVARIDNNPILQQQPLPPTDATALVEDRLTPISWGLTKINADAVWNGAASNSISYKGANIIIGGEDTGYEWKHPAIKSKYRGWNGTVANHNYNWHDAIHTLINGGANSCGINLVAPCDDDNHGTHTIGTMVGGPNNDSIIGVAPEAKWIGCRNMEEGDGTPSTYIECFQWFLAPTNLSNLLPDATKAPHVINNSWGCPVSEGCNTGNFMAMELAVNALKSAGIVVVVSAGNDGPGCSTINSPAAIYDNSFTVGATGSNDVIAGFSSRGNVTVDGSNRMKPDISAPGVGILSCIGHDGFAASYLYASYSGTSMAGPHIAGVVALVRCARPDITDVDAIETILKTSALPLYAVSPFCGGDMANISPNNVYGAGRVNALAAINIALALPVELLYFNVRSAGPDAVITWATAVELHCSHFEIERSVNSISWEQIGVVACGEHGNTEQSYTFYDKKPLDGHSYYRLKQVDDSGAAMYSPVAPLLRAAHTISLRVAPQPYNGTAAIDVQGVEPDAQWQLCIQSADGRLIQRWPAEQTNTIALPAMANGVYWVTLQEQSGRVLAGAKMYWAK